MRNGWDEVVDGSHKFLDLLFADFRITAFESGQSRTRDDRNVVAREFVLGEQFADFHFDELEQLFVVDLVDLVQEHDQRRNADLTGEQDVLTGLRHGAVSRVHHKDAAVHLGRAGDHVLHVVGVAGAVDVGVVTGVRLVFHVRRRDRDPTRFLFRCAVDLVVGFEVTEVLRDRRRQRRLAVVNVADGAHVHVRFVTCKLFLSHWPYASSVKEPNTGPIHDTGGK